MRIGIATSCSPSPNEVLRLRQRILGIAQEFAKSGGEDEVIIYTTNNVLDLSALSLIDRLSVLFDETTSSRRAASFFRRLPNGARCRLLIRWRSFPAGLRRIERIQLGYLAFIDQLDLLHLLGSNVSISRFFGVRTVDDSNRLLATEDAARTFHRYRELISSTVGG